MAPSPLRGAMVIDTSAAMVDLHHQQGKPTPPTGGGAPVSPAPVSAATSRSSSPRGNGSPRGGGFGASPKAPVSPVAAAPIKPGGISTVMNVLGKFSHASKISAALSNAGGQSKFAQRLKMAAARKLDKERSGSISINKTMPGKGLKMQHAVLALHNDTPTDLLKKNKMHFLQIMGVHPSQRTEREIDLVFEECHVIPFLQQFALEQKRALCRAMTLREVTPGQYLGEGHETLQQLYIIYHGRVHVYAVNADGSTGPTPAEQAAATAAGGRGGGAAATGGSKPTRGPHGHVRERRASFQMLATGKLKVYGKPCTVLEAGDAFGEESLIGKGSKDRIAVAATHAILLRLDVSIFQESFQQRVLRQRRNSVISFSPHTARKLLVKPASQRTPGDTETILTFMLTFDFFRQFDRPLAAELIKATTYKVYDQNELVQNVDDAPEGLYFVLHGSMIASKPAPKPATPPKPKTPPAMSSAARLKGRFKRAINKKIATMKKEKDRTVAGPDAGAAPAANPAAADGDSETFTYKMGDAVGQEGLLHGSNELEYRTLEDSEVLTIDANAFRVHVMPCMTRRHLLFPVASCHEALTRAPDDRSQRDLSLILSLVNTIGSGVFSQLSLHKRKMLCKSFRLGTHPKGERVVLQGDVGDTFYIILSGSAHVHITPKKPRVLPDDVDIGPSVHILQPGDTFGEKALLFDCPRSATIVTREFSQVITVSRESFNSVIDENFALAPNLSLEILKMEPHERLGGADRYLTNYLRTFRFWRRVPLPMLVRMLGAVRHRPLEAGQQVYAQSEKNTSFYVVMKGEVSLHKFGPRKTLHRASALRATVIAKLRNGQQQALYVPKAAAKLARLASLRDADADDGTDGGSAQASSRVASEAGTANNSRRGSFATGAGAATGDSRRGSFANPAAGSADGSVSGSSDDSDAESGNEDDELFEALETEAHATGDAAVIEATERYGTRVALASEGDAVGAYWWGGRGPRRAETAVAATACEVIELDVDMFRRWVADPGAKEIFHNECTRQVLMKQSRYRDRDDVRHLTDILTELDFIAQLPEPKLVAICRAARLRDVNPGETLMRQGDAGDSMYLVVTGSCDVYVQGKDKHKDARVERLANMGPGLASGEADLGRLVNVIGPGDPVGEQSLVTGMPRSATIVCRESAELIEILKSDFDSILNSEHDHTQYNPGVLRKRLYALNSRAMKLGKADAGVNALKNKMLGDLLRPLNVFAVMTETVFGAAISAMSPKTYPAGSDIYSVNDSASFVAIVVYGSVELFSSRGTLLATLGPGDQVGELEITWGCRRLASATARLDSFVMMLNRPAYLGKWVGSFGETPKLQLARFLRTLDATTQLPLAELVALYHKAQKRVLPRGACMLASETDSVLVIQEGRCQLTRVPAGDRSARVFCGRGAGKARPIASVGPRQVFAGSAAAAAKLPAVAPPPAGEADDGEEAQSYELALWATVATTLIEIPRSQLSVAVLAQLDRDMRAMLRHSDERREKAKDMEAVVDSIVRSPRLNKRDAKGLEESSAREAELAASAGFQTLSLAGGSGDTGAWGGATTESDTRGGALAALSATRKAGGGGGGGKADGGLREAEPTHDGPESAVPRTGIAAVLVQFDKQAAAAAAARAHGGALGGVMTSIGTLSSVATRAMAGTHGISTGNTIGSVIGSYRPAVATSPLRASSLGGADNGLAALSGVSRKSPASRPSTNLSGLSSKRMSSIGGKSAARHSRAPSSSLFSDGLASGGGNPILQRGMPAVPARDVRNAARKIAKPSQGYFARFDTNGARPTAPPPRAPVAGRARHEQFQRVLRKQ